MTMVRTNLGNTRERAGQLRYEPGGTISATNVQDAIAEAAAEAIVPTRTVTASGAVASTDVIVQTNQAAAIALTLPPSASWLAQSGRYGVPLSIFDISGTGAANNVTITPDGVETISGLPNLTINTNFGGWRLRPKSTGGWVFA